MSKPWKVVSQSPETVVLEREGQRKEIQRPQDKANQQIFMMLRPEELVDEATIQNFLTEGASEK